MLKVCPWAKTALLVSVLVLGPHAQADGVSDLKSALARLQGFGIFQLDFQFHDANLNVLTLNRKRFVQFIFLRQAGVVTFARPI